MSSKRNVESSLPSGQQTTRNSYDALGNLIQVVLPDATTIDYVVDGQNRRIGKKVNGTLVQAFVYQDQLNPVAEYDGSGNLISRFVFGSRSNLPDFMVRGGVTYRILSDHLSSPRLVVNVSSGSVVQRIDRDEFGRVTLDSNPGFQPFGFAAGITEEASGTVRFGRRDLDPETGRWLTRDPAGFVGSMTNLFGYVENDPVNLFDPTGLTWVYSQSSGQLSHINTSPGPNAGTVTSVTTGYSGAGPGLNNPALQSTPNVGPIPQGTYSIGAQRNSPNTGLGVLPLTPVPSNNMFGRTAFQIHGDNSKRNQSASEGCVILPRPVRNTIANSGDPNLVVIP